MVTGGGGRWPVRSTSAVIGPRAPVASPRIKTKSAAGRECVEVTASTMIHCLDTLAKHLAVRYQTWSRHGALDRRRFDVVRGGASSGGGRAAGDRLVQAT